MPKSLTEIEEEHGFVFGVPEDDESRGRKSASVLGHIKCETPGCARADDRAQAIPVHHDTVLPIVCGECGCVLKCNHVAGEEMIDVAGSVTAPVREIKIPCQICGSIIERRTENLRPVQFEDVPAATLAALGITFETDQ